MVGRDNVTFTFRIDSNKAAQAIAALEQALKRLGGAATSTGGRIDTTSNSVSRLGQQSAASAVNFQTATQGMLNLSTAAVQTFTSISNLDRANNRAKMSIIAVARAEDLLNNKTQRLKEMTEAGTTAGGKYANMQREIATATADLTVKQEKQKIEQAAVNDIYMLFASNIANVTISSLQTISILLGQEKMARLASVAAMKLQALAFRGTTTQIIGHNIATRSAIVGLSGYTLATFVATKATFGLTVAVKGLMVAAWPLLAVTVALTAAFAIHESNVLGTKTALDKLLGVEKDFESQVKEGRDGIETYDESLGKLNDTVGSSLPNSFESATKVMIAYTNSLRENTSVVEQNVESQIKLHGIIASGRNRQGGSATNVPIEILPQVNQGRGPGRQRGSFSSGGVPTQSNEALASALSVKSEPWSPFIMPQAFADRGDNVGRVIIPKEVKPQVESRRGKIQTPSAIASGAVLPTPESLQGDQTAMFKEGPDMNNQFTLFGHSGGVSNIPAVQDLAKDLGVSVESLEGSLSTGQFSIKQLQIANQILSGDLMTIKHVKDFVDSTKFKQFTPELEADRLILEKAKEQDKNFASIFRERYMGSGVSIDKILNELGKLEPDRKKRLDNKNKTFVDGIAFDLTKESGLKAHQKYMQAKLGQLIPTVNAFNFAGIKDKQKELTGDQYLRFLGGQGLNDTSSFTNRFGQSELDGYSEKLNNSTSNVILNKNQNSLLSKIQNGEISGNRAEVLLEFGIDIGNAANNYSKADAQRFAKLQRASNALNGQIGGQDIVNGVFGGNATQAYQTKGKIVLNEGARNNIRASRRGDAFRNGAGGIIANISTALTGGPFFTGYRFRAGTGSDIANKKYRGAKSIIQKAISMGIKSNPEWTDRLAEIPAIDPKAVDAIAQAEFAALAAESLATQYVASINSQMTSIGFTTALTSASNTAGFSGIGMYENIALLSATRRTNFSNTEIIGESRSKLNLTNSQVNAIRFNSTRGDIELQDRLRYVDQLDAMASGTSPL
tara:strand:+ start:2425 stop:5469 length:3045 start_codon:yes stop_codon:yes gene_type:complete